MISQNKEKSTATSFKLVSLKRYGLRADIASLVRAACEDRQMTTVAEVTDEDLITAINDPHSFWHVAIGDGPYSPLLGVVSLQNFNPVDGTGEMGVSVTPEYWGQHLGARLVVAMRDWAVATLNLRRLTNYILDDSPGRLVAEALGDTLEGTLRQHRYKEGRYVDVHIYSWLRGA